MASRVAGYWCPALTREQAPAVLKAHLMAARKSAAMVPGKTRAAVKPVAPGTALVERNPGRE